MSLYVPIVFSAIPILRERGISEFQILEVLRRVAIKYTPIIQRTTPVDTGRLKKSIRVEILLDNNGVAITSEVFYAGFVEYGTRKMRPRLFAAQYVPAIVDEIRAGLDQLAPNLPKPELKQVRNDESGLYSGITTQQLSEQLIGKVINNLVIPRTVGRLSIQPEVVEEDKVIELSIINQVAV